MEDDPTPVLIHQQRKSLDKHYLARDALFEKKVTLAQAKTQGYREDLEAPWGMSELRPEEVK